MPCPTFEKKINSSKSLIAGRDWGTDFYDEYYYDNMIFLIFSHNSLNIRNVSKRIKVPCILTSNRSPVGLLYLLLSTAPYIW